LLYEKRCLVHNLGEVTKDNFCKFKKYNYFRFIQFLGLAKGIESLNVSISNFTKLILGDYILRKIAKIGYLFIPFFITESISFGKVLCTIPSNSSQKNFRE